MSLTDSSLSLAPRRRSSLLSKPRPKTACGIPQEAQGYNRRRHSDLPFLDSSTDLSFETRSHNSIQSLRRDTMSIASGSRPEGTSQREINSSQAPTSRRTSNISQSWRNGVSELRLLGRRLSTSVRAKNGKSKHDGTAIYHARVTTEPLCTLEERPQLRGWLRAPTIRRRPSLPALKFVSDPSPPRYSIIGPVPGSSRGPPILPDNLFGGAGARAAAAAQNEAFHATRPPPNPPVDYAQRRLSDIKLTRDSESGIGIDLDLSSRRGSEVVDTNVLRFDPSSVLATELMEHLLQFLDPDSLLHSGKVSRKWRSLALSQTVWRHVFLREYSRFGATTPATAGPRTAAGLGKGNPNQDWRKMYKIRRLLDGRWRSGEAAAIYLNGHKDSVYCVQFDGSKIITGSRDHTVRVWDARTYQCVRKLGPPNVPRDRHQLQRSDVEPQGVLPFCTIEFSSPDPVAPAVPDWHSQSILCLQYDNEILVTGSSDFSCIVWSIKDDYRPLFRLRGHLAGVLDVCIDPTRIITCSKDTTIKVWDRQTGRLVRTMIGHRGPVNAIQLQGDLLVSASGDGMSKLWRLGDGVCIKEFSSQDRGLACVEFSADGRTIFAGGNDQVIYEYDSVTGRTVRELKSHTDLVRSLHLDSVNGRIVSGSYDSSVKVWDCKLGRGGEDGLRISFEGWTTSWILSAKSDYRRIVCTSQDGRVLIIDFGYGIEGVELLDD